MCAIAWNDAVQRCSLIFFLNFLLIFYGNIKINVSTVDSIMCMHTVQYSCLAARCFLFDTHHHHTNTLQSIFIYIYSIEWGSADLVFIKTVFYSINKSFFIPLTRKSIKITLENTIHTKSLAIAQSQCMHFYTHSL